MKPASAVTTAVRIADSKVQNGIWFIQDECLTEEK